ncbi:DUF5304 domain-containing protein [Streptomyces sp. 549]|uniref:DUF5304 domain-containing protein n=1 Tax=Streptomyces sp. 549 TaxID=3049076 RepID=UPI0024C41D5F|nr:DUF5304 domain-containing protein [Streptomyces sp. 549]MDK1475551.1 DUF5304 domain-containing protein [Streptomyces sp. 549]
MSDATDPTDAWADACAEDLAAEQARRRERYGTPPGSAAEELRKLADTVAQRIADLAGPLTGSAAGSVAAQSAAQSAERAARQFAEGARAVVEPVVERNPQVFQHLSAAGSELLAAYRAAVSGHEQRWTRGDRPETTPVDTADPAGPAEAADPADPAEATDPAGRAGDQPAAGDAAQDKRNDGDRETGRGRGEDGPAGTERIDLD